MVDKVAAHFKPKLIIIVECFRFYKQAQQSGEKTGDYIAELCRLAATCNFKDFLEELSVIFSCVVSIMKRYSIDC